MRKTVPDLSILIVARNEESHLEGCLRSATFAREIVVVLDRTTDGSADIARSFEARILTGAWPVEGDRRNTGIDLCTSEWILELDADERISDELRDEIQTILLVNPKHDYYYIKLHNRIGGVWVPNGWGAYNGVMNKACLFKKGSKIWGEEEIHPSLLLKGSSGTLSGHIDHFVDDDAAGVVDRLNRYSTVAAVKMVREQKNLRVFVTFRQFFSRFFKVYYQRRGFKEGWRGLLLAIFSGLYPVLTHIKALELTEARSENDV